MVKISVPSRLWYENEERELIFPDSWQIDDLNPPGFVKPALSPSLIREKIANPIAGPPLAEIAKGKKEAIIVCDDMTRPTPIKDIAPRILEILHHSGMKREQIRFLWALGAHGAHDMSSARKKGKGFLPKVLKKLIVINPYPDCTFLDLICHIDDALIVKSWPEVLTILKNDLPLGARGAVVQDGTMMYLKG